MNTLTATMPDELRLCPFCRTKTALRIHDDKTLRAYECAVCLAVEKITKGKTSWWYHGSQQLDEDGEPGLRCDGDRKTAKAPIPFAKWVRDIETSS